MNNPRVSILMNCYNGEKYLEQAIESVLSQTYQNWEIIFWDNQSTDNSSAIFKRYSDPRLKYYYAPIHTVLYGARNYAIEKATGEFIAFLDVDDWWLPEKLEKQMQLFLAPEVGVVCANYWLVNERKNNRKIMFKKPVPTGWVLNDLLKFYYPGLLTLVIRKAALDKLDYIFNSRYNLIGDMELLVRLCIEWKLDYISEPLAFYRLHGNNVSLVDAARNVGEMEDWISEVVHNQAIVACPNYHFAKLKISYVKILQKILSGNKTEAWALLREFPLSVFKFRLLAAMFIPAAIIRKLKN